MNTVAIDINTLNSLFDNQKKLDEVFDSIFDDDNFFISSSSSSEEVNRYAVFDVETQVSMCGSNLNQSLVALKQHPLFFVLPIVLEISVIYLVLTHLL